jgi:spoIIIJ-associated protein
MSEQAVDVVAEGEVGADDFPAIAEEIVRTLLELMGLDAEVSSVTDDDPVEVAIEGADAALVVGRKGQTLDALQYIVNRVATRRVGDHPLVVVNADGYRERREASLTEMAHRLSEKAQDEGKIVALNPMSARDRRVVHMALRDNPSVTTRSEGDGDERRLLIVPVD